MGALSAKKAASWGAVSLLILSVTVNAHFLRVVVAGDALWNDHEAYFFVRRINRGIEKKWIQVPFFVALNWLGIIEPPVDNSASLIVLHVTPSGFERHDLQLDPRPGTNPSGYTPREGRIWANYWSLGGLCWWAGDHFEPATAEEKQRIGDMFQLDNNHSPGNGWSGHDLRDLSFRVKFANGAELPVYSGPDAIDIQLEQGKGATSIFRLDERAGLTSRAEYLSLFSHSHEITQKAR